MVKLIKWILPVLGTIFLGLITSAIYDFIKAQPFLTAFNQVISSLWRGLLLFSNLNLRVWWLLLGSITFWFLIHFLLKKQDKEWDTKIGHYTFKELYDIFRTERVEEQTVAMRYANESVSDILLLDLFIEYHSLLSIGVDLDTNDNGLLYGIICPKLYLFGLMDKHDFRHGSADLTVNRYLMNENGKLFWALLNKFSIPNRLKEEKVLANKARVK